eukprot:Pgem_evm1s1174
MCTNLINFWIPQGIFSTSSVNYDWFQAILSWNLSLGDIKKIALDSIMHSFASDAEKTKLLKLFNAIEIYNS